MQLPTSVLDTGKTRSDHTEDSFVWTCCAAGQQRHEIPAVNCPIVGRVEAGCVEHRYKQVHHHRRRVIHMTGRDPARPPRDAGHAIATFPRGGLHSAEAPRVAAKPRTIIASENHQRVLVQMQVLDRRKQLANLLIQFRDDVGVKPFARLLVEFLRTGQWFVRHGVRKVKKEGYIFVTLHEFDSALRVTPGQRGLHHRVLNHLLTFQQMHRPHIVAVGNAEVLVESAPRRQELRFVTQMPLANAACGVARLLEELCQRDFGMGQAQRIRFRRGVRRRISRHPAAERIATGQQRRATRRAKRHRDVELRQSHPSAAMRSKQGVLNFLFP